MRRGLWRADLDRETVTGGHWRTGSEKGEVERRQLQGDSGGEAVRRGHWRAYLDRETVTGGQWKTGSEKGVVEARQ